MICSLPDKLLITHVQLKQSYQSYLMRLFKSKVIWKIFTILLNNYPVKIEALHWVTLRLSENCITVSVDLNLSFLRKIRKNLQNQEMFITLSAMYLTKIDCMNSMVYNQVQSFLVNMSNQNNGLKSLKNKFKTEF